MLSLKFLPVVLAFSVMPPAASAQQPMVPSKVVDRIADQHFGEVPDGDRYFFGRAALAKGLELEPLNRERGMKQKIFEGWGDFFSMEFVPAGFLQMIYLDTNGLDRQHYKFEYIGREFLDDVGCIVFDVEFIPKAGKRRFVGRIWVEDHDYYIVRFIGSYGMPSSTSYYFNFESWRMNVGPNLWVPAYVYVEDGSVQVAKAKNLGFKPFRAQTRLWGYHVERVDAKQEPLEGPLPVVYQTEFDGDFTWLQAERSRAQKAEDNVVDHLERQGLLAPHGEVDEVLETIVQDLETTNDLDIQPVVRCRVLMTSTLESFTVSHTIVLSRGLIDVLPDKASLASILANELGHILLGHRMDTQFAFLNRLRFDEKETFRRFDFTRSPEEEQSAKDKGTELLKNSPYKDQSSSAQLFLQALKDRSKDIPNLISPHLGDKVPTNCVLTSAASSAQPNNTKTALRHIRSADTLGLTRGMTNCRC